MDSLLRMREEAVFLYKRNETVVNYMLRFIAGLVVLNIVNGIGQYNEIVEFLFVGGSSLPFLLLEALMFMLLPATLGNFIVCMNVVLQVSQSIEVAFFVFLALSLVLVFYSRLVGRKSLVVIAMIIGFYFRIPYAVVLFAGLYLGLGSIVGVTIATYIWGLAPIVGGILKTAPLFDVNNLDAMEIWKNLLETYGKMANGFAEGFGSLFTAFVFAMAILAVFTVSKLTIDYSKEIAIAVGALATMFGYIVGILISSIQFSLLEVFLFLLLSTVIVLVLKFFDIALNYKKAERVEFQDEENYYYVKIIPKVIFRRMVADRRVDDKRSEYIDMRDIELEREKKTTAASLGSSETRRASTLSGMIPMDNQSPSETVKYTMVYTKKNDADIDINHDIDNRDIENPDSGL